MLNIRYIDAVPYHLIAAENSNKIAFRTPMHATNDLRIALVEKVSKVRVTTMRSSSHSIDLDLKTLPLVIRTLQDIELFDRQYGGSGEIPDVAPLVPIDIEFTLTRLREVVDNSNDPIDSATRERLLKIADFCNRLACRTGEDERA